MNETIELKRAAQAATTVEVDIAGLSAQVAVRAAEEGILDVAYCDIESPVGTLLAVATTEGLVQIGFPDQPRDELLAALATRISPRLLEAPARLDPVRRQLDEYFDGRRREFGLDVDWRLSGGFRQRVLRETARIPFGETRSYMEMAASAGSPRAHRAAGSALGSNPIPIVVPCHRVLRAGGGLGGYAGGLQVKEKLLKLEGILGS